MQNVIDIIKGSNLKLNIEIKSKNEWINSYQTDLKTFAQSIDNIIKKNNLPQETLIQSFHHEILNEVHLLAPNYNIGLLIEDKLNINQHLKRLSFQPQYINVDYRLITKSIIREIHAREQKILAWTVNDSDTAKKLIDLGVNGIITDYPDTINKSIL